MCSSDLSFVKPIIKAIDEARAAGKTHDLSSLKMMLSSGVMWTSEVKEQLLDRVEHLVLVDAMGSSEGSMGTSISMKGIPPQTAKFSQMATTKVFTDDDREAADTLGGLVMARLGRIPELGDAVEIGGHIVTVEALDGRRVHRVRVRRKGSTRGQA